MCSNAAHIHVLGCRVGKPARPNLDRMEALMKFFLYRILTKFFKRLERFADRAALRFDYCEFCGENKYNSTGCFGRPLTYKVVR